MTDYNIDRDRWGRPMLFPPTGGKKAAYTRPSTMAKWLDDKGGLINWKASQAMIGMAKSKSLQARVAAIVARTQNDAYRENKAALKELVETASQIAQASGRADFGTAIHEFTDLMDAGTLDWQFVPEQLKGPLNAYREGTQHLRVFDSEVFVAVDEVHGGKNIRAAGSLDRIYEHPDLGVVVSDLKTGTDEPKYPLGVMSQVAIYARGKRYRDATFGEAVLGHVWTANPDGTAWRAPLHPDLNPTAGLLVHCPLEPVNGKYICDIYLLPLQNGWNSVLLGHTVQSARRPKGLVKL